MQIGILGTGVVGRAHAAKLAELGHDVLMGTQDVAKTLNESAPDQMGNAPFSVWHNEHASVKLGTFVEAARHGVLVYNALKGEVSVSVLKTVEEELGEKTLFDIANPLDFSKGMPPSLTVCNTDSLGEQIQAALPKVKVVKACNTMSAPLQVNPGLVNGGDHHAFVCGNDAVAKAEVVNIMKKGYGWINVIDLGDITSARGTEMYLPIWLRIWGATKTPMFNIKVVQAEAPAQ